jgi:hypothetical protein
VDGWMAVVQQLQLEMLNHFLMPRIKSLGLRLVREKKIFKYHVEGVERMSEEVFIY